MLDTINSGTKTFPSFIYKRQNVVIICSLKNKKVTRQNQFDVQFPLNPKGFTYIHMVMLECRTQVYVLITVPLKTIKRINVLWIKIINAFSIQMEPRGKAENGVV